MTAFGIYTRTKRLVVGRPIPSHAAHHERLSRFTGLAVLSSDPLSSVAYATEEILRVLIVAGVGTLYFSTPIAVLIASILAVVVFSYRQTIHAYPNGGGAYIVAKENLGEVPALVAAAALLIDYVLTVSVSIAAGVAAITSAFPGGGLNPVFLAIGFVAVLTVGNLRGIRESGRLFALPTYFFVVSLLVLIGIGAWQVLTGRIVPVTSVTPMSSAGHTLTAFLLLRAFANGCTAMTGVEAVSNGVPAFKAPEAKNAAATMMTMAVLSITMFLGITALASAFQIVPSEHETVVSQLARGVFGGRGVPYYLVQAATMLILVLAANTAYADFPRLASILARDGYVPRQLLNQGDRLAFSNGIIGLSVFAVLLLVIYRGDTHSLIPLYMIGVFLSFTLSQLGMVRHWWREHREGWATSAAINGFGALVTGIVLVVVAITKAAEGAWVILLLIPLHVATLPGCPAALPACRAAAVLEWLDAVTTPQHRDRPGRAAFTAQSYRRSSTRKPCRRMCGPSTSVLTRPRPSRSPRRGGSGGRAFRSSRSTRRIAHSWSRCSSTSNKSVEIGTTRSSPSFCRNSSRRDGGSICFTTSGRS